MFERVKLTACELAELLGKTVPHFHEEPLPGQEIVPGGAGKHPKRCSSLACRIRLTSAEISLLTRPFGDPLETTVL